MANPPEIVALAEGLGASRTDITDDDYNERVFEYVNKNIDVEFRFELGKGARGALVDQSGTALDQAALMVELIRQRGIVASYNVGTITLTADEFGRWSGLVQNLNEAAQTFTVDAKAACQFLANGAIPAIINGSSDCSSVSGSLATVTLGHAWVMSGGKAYDPTYKPHRIVEGIDLSAAAGCGTASNSTCGSAAKVAAVSGATTGTYLGYPTLKNINTTALASQLDAKATNIENAIRLSGPEAPLVDMAGGMKRDMAFAPNFGASLPYPSSVQFTWSGDVPDQYRATLRFELLDVDETFFLDELSGRSLRFVAQARLEGNSYSNPPKEHLYVDDTSIAETNCVWAQNQGYSCGLSRSSWTHYHSSGSWGYSWYPDFLTLTINHGYAIAAYGDRQVRQFLGSPLDGFSSWFQTDSDGITIAVATGETLPSRAAHFDAMTSVDLVDRLTDSSGRAASVLVDQTEAGRLVAGALNAAITRHHRIGTFEASTENPLGGTTSLSGSLTSLSGSVSVVGQQVTAQESEAIFRVLSDFDSLAEQERTPNKDPNPLPLSNFANLQQLRFVDVPNSGISTYLNQIANLDQDTRDGFLAAQTAGYDIIAPVPNQYGNYGCIEYTPYGGTTGKACTTTLSSWGLNFRSGAYANLIAQRFKGDTSPIQGINKKEDDKDLEDKRYLDLDLASGSVRALNGTDITAGVGEFPYALPLIRYYDSSVSVSEARYALIQGPTNFPTVSAYSGPTPYMIEETGSPIHTRSMMYAGWSHNYDVWAEIGGSWKLAIGQRTALESSAALAGAITLRDLHFSGDFGSSLASVFVSNWIDRQARENRVAVKWQNLDMEFARLPSGAFVGSPGSNSYVEVNATGGQNYATSFGTRFGYTDLSIEYLDGEGGLLRFDDALGNGTSDPSRFVYPASFQNAAGVKVNFIMGGGHNSSLDEVTNSLGRKLIFADGTTVESVSDDAGRSVSYATRNCPDYDSSGSNNLVALSFVCDNFDVTLPDGSKILYEYSPDIASPNPANPVRPTYRLRRVFSSDDPTTPIQSIEYDDLFRVKVVESATGEQLEIFPDSIGSEKFKRTDVRDVLGNVSTAKFDDTSSQIGTVDPLGRETARVNNDIGQLLREVMPEGDAVEHTYDVRGNRLTSCHIAKGRVVWSGLGDPEIAQCDAGQGDLLTETQYVEGPLVQPESCVNGKTCNKPLLVIDPNGNAQGYTWSTVHGGVLTEKSGLDSFGACNIAGGCPEKAYGYSSFTGVDGATFWLLTSLTEKTIGSNVVTTTYEYDPTNKFVMKGEVVTSGSSTFRTCYSYDAVGRRVSETRPSANLTSCP